MKLRHLFFIVPLICFASSALAEKILIKKNSLGGDVVETIYEEGDNEFKFQKKRSYYDATGYKLKDESFVLDNDYNDLGLMKTVKAYNQQGQLIQVDLVFREEKAFRAGYGQIVVFFDDLGNRKRMDVHFVDENPDQRIYSHVSNYYDISGTKTRTVYFFTERLINITGYHRIIEQYDQRGHKINETIMDKDGISH